MANAITGLIESLDYLTLHMVLIFFFIFKSMCNDVSLQKKKQDKQTLSVSRESSLFNTQKIHNDSFFTLETESVETREDPEL